MDAWVARDPDNASRLVDVLAEFGFERGKLDTALFLIPDRVVRMGVPPMRLQLIASASGVEFSECYRLRIVDTIDGVTVTIIDSEAPKRNKRASGRLKDLADLENLP